ncbi:MAG: FeoA family protein [Lachnospiraceae bacterium]
MKKLSELKTGSSGTVVRISGDTHFQSRITAIGLTVESRLEVIQNHKNQPVLLYSRDTMIAINKKDSEKVMVEVIN